MTHDAVMRMLRLLVVLIILPLDAAASDRELIVLPRPEGRHAAGYWRTTLVTPQLDALTSTPDDVRRLALEIWYPAANDGGGTRKPYATDFVAAGLAEAFPLPPGFASAIVTHALNDAAPADGRFPVVLFSHGLSWPVSLYQAFTEDLASRGYVVVGVNHQHGTTIDYEGGGHLGREAWPKIEDEAERQEMLASHLMVWQRDLRNVIDELARWTSGEAPHPVVSKMDLNRLGVAGHSYGGSAAAALSDPRVRAIGVMEAVVRNKAGHVQAAAPLLHLIGGYNRLELEGRSYRPSREAPVYQVVINGTGHAYFSDLIHIYRHYADDDWKQRHRYEVVPDRVIQIARDYLAAFFDQHLKGQPIHMLLEPRSYAARVEGPKQAGYPEVEISITVK